MSSSACFRLRRSAMGDGGSASSEGIKSERSRASSATMTASRTVSPPNPRAFWNARPIPRRARRYGAMLSMRRPNTLMSPDDFTNPLIAFISVVLPAPFVPMSPTTSPGWTSIDAPTTTNRPRYCTRTSLATSAGTGAVAPSPDGSRAGRRNDNRESEASVSRTAGFQFVRRAMNDNNMSRPEWTIEIKPPGQ